MDNPNIWIAEDPTQPGTAFAVHTANDSVREYLPETLKEWADLYGVKGRLVNKDDGLRMFDAWDKTKSQLVPRNKALN